MHTIILSAKTDLFIGRKENHKGMVSEKNNTLGCLEGCYTDYKNLTEKVVPEAQLPLLYGFVTTLKTRGL